MDDNLRPVAYVNGQHFEIGVNLEKTSPSPMNNQCGKQQQEQREASSMNGTEPFFFQLTGHKQSFRTSKRPQETILKRSTGNEKQCLEKLMLDGESMKEFVPKLFNVLLLDDAAEFLEIENLFMKFNNQPSQTNNDANVNCLMDIKVGSRTYREEELGGPEGKTKLRPDMYEKMIQVDENEPTCAERVLKAITKPRYMTWRESLSSTATLGFRIDAMRLPNGCVKLDFKTTKDVEQIREALLAFTQSEVRTKIRNLYLVRLCQLRRALMSSNFFAGHELIGVSLFFVHRNRTSDPKANVWLIDFAKTYPLPNNIKITHKANWKMGNHEDGFLIGIDNLIEIFKTIQSESCDTTR